MRSIFLLLLITLFAILISSCQRNQVEPVQLLPYEIDWEIPAGLNNFETHFFEFPNIRTRVNEFFDGSGIPLEEISVIQARQAELVVLEGNQILEDVRTLEVYLIDPMDPDREYEAFYTLDLQNPNQRDRSIRLIPSLTNLLPIFQNERMDVMVRINFWRNSSRNLAVRLDMELEALK